LLEDFGLTDRRRRLDIDDDRVDLNQIVVRIGEDESPIELLAFRRRRG
jgi:hypothetical protein